MTALPLILAVCIGACLGAVAMAMIAAGKRGDECRECERRRDG